LSTLVNFIGPKRSISSNSECNIQESCVSNIYVRLIHFKNNGNTESIKYPFDHIALLSDGKVKIVAEGISKEFCSPALIFVKKDLIHELIALEDNTVVLSIHGIRDGNRVEDVIDPEMIIIPPGSPGIDYIKDNNLMQYITGEDDNNIYF